MLEFTPRAVSEYVKEAITIQRTHHDKMRTSKSQVGHTNDAWHQCDANSCRTVYNGMLEFMALAKDRQEQSLAALCHSLGAR